MHFCKSGCVLSFMVIPRDCPGFNIQIWIERIEKGGFSDAGLTTETWPRWVIDACVAGTIYDKDGATFIRTLEGDHRVSDGDWIIRGVKGEFYPCKADIFEATYEAVDQSRAALARREEGR